MSGVKISILLKMKSVCIYTIKLSFTSFSFNVKALLSVKLQSEHHIYTCFAGKNEKEKKVIVIEEKKLFELFSYSVILQITERGKLYTRLFSLFCKRPILQLSGFEQRCGFLETKNPVSCVPFWYLTTDRRAAFDFWAAFLPLNALADLFFADLFLFIKVRWKGNFCAEMCLLFHFLHFATGNSELRELFFFRGRLKSLIIFVLTGVWLSCK